MHDQFDPPRLLRPSQRLRPLLPILVLFVVSVSALAGPPPAVAQDKILNLPREALSLLPGSCEVIIVIDDPEQLDAGLHDLYRRVDSAAADTVSFLAMLDDFIPNIAAIIDPSRPVIVAWQVLSPLESAGIQRTVVLPLRKEMRDEVALSVLTGVPRVEVSGGYAALATDPDYRPGGQPPDLAGGLPAGDLVMRADLETIVTLYRPLVEMGLMVLAQQQQATTAVDSTATATEAYLLETLDSQTIATLTEIAGGFMDSARRLTITAELADGQLELRETLTIVPGSVLDPGPQPSFTDAVALTKYLPDDSAYLSVSAIDLAAQLARFPALAEFLLQAATTEMSAEFADPYRAWLEQILATAQYWSQPTVQTTDITDAGFRYVVLLQDDDASAALDRLVSSYMALGTLDLGMTLEAVGTREIAGHTASGYRMEFDPTILAAATADTLAAVEYEDLLDLQAMFGLVVPVFWVTTTGDLVIACGDPRGESALAELLQKVQTEGGRVPAAVSAAQAWSGERTQYLVVGDLRRMMTGLLTVWTATGEDAPPVPPAGDPIDIRLAVGVGEHRLEVAARIDLAELFGFIALLEEMETRDE